jgi:primosomal replication protein N
VLSNQLLLTAVVESFSPLAYTVGGVPVVKMVLFHQSRQVEDSVHRQVHVKIEAVVVGDSAVKFAANPPKKATFLGFLNQKSLHQSGVVFHVNGYEIVNENI